MKLTDTIPIHIYNIKWDIDEDDKDTEIPSTDFIQVFTGYELKDVSGKHDPISGDFEITDDEITEFLSDWLSDKLAFCHFGFEWDIVKENPYNLTPNQVLKLIALLGNLQDSIQDDIEFSDLKPSMEVIVAKDKAQDFLKKIIGDYFFDIDYITMINEND